MNYLDNQHALKVLLERSMKRALELSDQADRNPSRRLLQLATSFKHAALESQMQLTLQREEAK